MVGAVTHVIPSILLELRKQFLEMHKFEDVNEPQQPRFSVFQLAASFAFLSFFFVPHKGSQKRQGCIGCKPSSLSCEGKNMFLMWWIVLSLLFDDKLVVELDYILFFLLKSPFHSPVALGGSGCCFVAQREQLYPVHLAVTSQRLELMPSLGTLVNGLTRGPSQRSQQTEFM